MLHMSTALALLAGLLVAMASSADAGHLFRALLRTKNSEPANSSPGWPNYISDTVPDSDFNIGDTINLFGKFDRSCEVFIGNKYCNTTFVNAAQLTTTACLMGDVVGVLCDGNIVLRSKGETEKSVNSRGVVNIELMEDGMWHGIVSIHNIVDHVTAHIHEGAKNTAGPIVFSPLPADIPILTGTFSYPIVFNSSIFDENTLTVGGYYFNVHTVPFPLGEIRGQFLPPS